MSHNEPPGVKLTYWLMPSAQYPINIELEQCLPTQGTEANPQLRDIIVEPDLIMNIQGGTTIFSIPYSDRSSSLHFLISCQ